MDENIQKRGETVIMPTSTRSLKVIGPQEVVVTNEKDLQKRESPWDLKGVFIEVLKEVELPDGFQSLPCHVRDSRGGTRPIKLLGKKDIPYKFSGRCMADKFLSHYNLENI